MTDMGLFSKKVQEQPVDPQYVQVFNNVLSHVTEDMVTGLTEDDVLAGVASYSLQALDRFKFLLNERIEGWYAAGETVHDHDAVAEGKELWAQVYSEVTVYLPNGVPLHLAA